MRLTTSSATTLLATLAVTTQVAVLVPARIATADPSAGAAPTVVALSKVPKRCDFSEIKGVPPAGVGTGFALVSTTASHRVIAEVHLTATPDTHYGVRLIELPRPWGTCGAGDWGTAAGSLDTDAAGAGTTTIEEGILPSTTGAWIAVDGPPGDSKILSGDFFSSDYVFPI